MESLFSVSSRCVGHQTFFHHLKSIAGDEIVIRERNDITTSVDPTYLFAPKTADAYEVCSDKWMLLKRNITCPHDEHHYDDDEFSGPQLSSLTDLLHRHLVWREKTHTHTESTKCHREHCVSLSHRENVKLPSLCRER